MKIIIQTIIATSISFLMLGCASNSAVRTNSGQYDSLYEANSKIAYATKLPAASSVESVARGDRAMHEGDKNRALYEYVNALEMGGRDAETFFKIGMIHEMRDNIASARMAYGWAIQQNPKYAAALERFGLILMNERKHQKARQYLDQAINANNKLWRAHNALGVLADLRKDYPSALMHYNEAISYNPDSTQIINNRGYSSYLSGEWPAAEDDFKTAINKDINNKKAWQNLGLLYARQQMYNQALNAFNNVMDPHASYNNLGYLCMLDGKYEKAEEYLLKAISLSPRYYEAAQKNLVQNREILGQILEWSSKTSTSKHLVKCINYRNKVNSDNRKESKTCLYRRAFTDDFKPDATALTMEHGS